MFRILKIVNCVELNGKIIGNIHYLKTEALSDKTLKSQLVENIHKSFLIHHRIE